MMSRRFAIIEPTYAFYSVETPGDEWYAAEALCLFSVLPSLRPGMKGDSHVGTTAQYLDYSRSTQKDSLHAGDVTGIPYTRPYHCALNED